MKNIPTDQLRAFIVIVECGSFTGAGDRLARSQSSISLQIKKLEQLVGREVFVRKGHNFELTPAGDILLRYARQILHLNDSMLGELSGNAVTGKVRLGIPSEFAVRLLPKIVGDFSRQHPQITLEVRCDLSRTLNQDLKQKKYDLVLSIIDKPKEFDGDYLIEDELVWVSAAELAIQDQQPVSLILAPEGCLYRKRAIERLREANIDWNVTYTNMDIGGITSAVEAGLGVTVLAKKTLPESLADIEPPLGSERLGAIGLTVLTAPHPHHPKACDILAEYIKAHL